MRYLPLLMLLLFQPALCLEIEVSEKYPIRQEPVILTIRDGQTPIAGVKLTALYAPNSKVSSHQELGVTGADGRLEWAPTRAGLVKITAGKGEQSQEKVISVRFDSFQPTGILTMVFAGLLLFGGIAFGFYIVLGGETTPEPLMDT